MNNLPLVIWALGSLYFVGDAAASGRPLPWYMLVGMAILVGMLYHPPSWTKGK